MDSIYNIDPKKLKKIMAVAFFAGGIAHDYNNALTVVLGNLSLAKLEADDNPDLMDSLNDAEAAAANIKDLTERLSIYGKGLKPDINICNVSETVEGVLDQIKSRENIFFNLSIDDSGLEFQVDRQQFEMVLALIFENAVEACESGKAEITITSGKVHIDEEKKFKEITLHEGDYICVDITDNGKGLEGLDLEKIFDPFFSTKENHDGLGLSLSYAVIKRHKGFIDISEAENGGGALKIYLPVI